MTDIESECEGLRDNLELRDRALANMRAERDRLQRLVEAYRGIASFVDDDIVDCQGHGAELETYRAAVAELEGK